MLGSSVKDLASSLAAKVSSSFSPALSQGGGEATIAPTSTTTSTPLVETATAGTAPPLNKPEIDAVIFEVHPMIGVDAEMLRAQIMAIRIPRVVIGEVRIQREAWVHNGPAKLTIAAQVTDPQVTTLARLEEALQNIQVGNHGAVSSVERESFSKVLA
jgi:hypothetical protein